MFVPREPWGSKYWTSGAWFRESHRSNFGGSPSIRDTMRRNHIGSRFPRDRSISNLLAGHPEKFPAGCARRFCMTLPSNKSNKSW